MCTEVPFATFLSGEFITAGKETGKMHSFGVGFLSMGFNQGLMVWGTHFKVSESQIIKNSTTKVTVK